MPLRGSNSYLLRESNEFPMDAQQFTAVFAGIHIKLENLKMIDERLIKVGTHLKNYSERVPNRIEREEECGLLVPYQRQMKSHLEGGWIGDEANLWTKCGI